MNESFLTFYIISTSTNNIKNISFKLKNHQDLTGNTPFHYLNFNNTHKTIQKQINNTTIQNIHGTSIAHNMCKNYKSWMKPLLTNIDSIYDEDGHTPLYYLCISNLKEVSNFKYKITSNSYFNLGNAVLQELNINKKLTSKYLPKITNTKYLQRGLTKKYIKELSQSKDLEISYIKYTHNKIVEDGNNYDDTKITNKLFLLFIDNHVNALYIKGKFIYRFENYFLYSFNYFYI